ncbi:hypothetical protein OTK49_00795 [Vibrio coralliirubri]|uniref:hypothetical protein n=1 Tax=Vibrio coralliirubri TaxID=1516159 RepID=UPI002284DF36|nr:hypothetical protein [Vibrio coralliirubri]MCY9861068.1 hypothetical protein [Vibrio coralliirubri]
MSLALFIQFIAIICIFVGAAYGASMRLGKMNQKGSLTSKYVYLASGAVALFGSVLIFSMSLAADVGLSGIGVSDAFMSGASSFEVALDVMLNLPTDIYVRSFGLAILCFVATVALLGLVLLLAYALRGKVGVSCGLRSACVLFDSQVNQPMLVAFSFTPALVALFLTLSSFTGYSVAVTDVKLTESQVRHLKGHCEFGLALIDNTTLVCDNKILAKESTSVTTFNSGEAHVLILWDGKSDGFENYVLIRTKGDHVSAHKESDATTLINAYLSDY